MKILIDTNILIHAEDPKETPANLQKLFQLINSVNTTIYYHPASIDDLNRDTDTTRKTITLSKLAKYKLLPKQQNFTEDSEFCSKLGNTKSNNDYVDAQLLFSVYCNAIDYFITNDQQLIRRASKVNCEEKVFDISDAINIFESVFFKGVIPNPISLKEELMKNIDYTQSFFDSLRKDYLEFNNWFETKSTENRKAFVHSQKNKIDAILVLKSESGTIKLVNDFLPPKRRIKICLMKSDLNHTNIGELFIKLAICTAIKQKVDEVFLTHFVKPQDYLVTVLERFGFKCAGKQQTTNGAEEVFVKSIIGNAIVPQNDKGITKFNHVYYPSFYDGKMVKKFIVPIRPKYYNKLFPEDNSRQTTIFENTGEFIIEGNAIKKAYISTSPNKKLQKNDLLIFYLTGESKTTVIGTVESVTRSSIPEEIMKLVARRTVYTKKEIFAEASKEKLVILFKWNFHFPRQINLTILKKEKLLKAQPQSIQEISHEKYIKLKQLSTLDNQYTVSTP